MKNELTLEQAVAEKSILEEKIAKLLHDFLEKTNYMLPITDLSLVAIDTHGRAILTVEVEVTLP